MLEPEWETFTCDVKIGLRYELSPSWSSISKCIYVTSMQEPVVEF
jgi:hypothetical protein